MHGHRNLKLANVDVNYNSALKTNELGLSEMSVNYYRTTGRYNPDDINFRSW